MREAAIAIGLVASTALLSAARPEGVLAFTPPNLPPRTAPAAPGARYLPQPPPLWSSTGTRPASATVDHPPTDGASSFDNGPRDSSRLALTFDADMTPAMLQQLRGGAVRSWYNREVREILDSEQVPATIFLTGLWAATYPEQARSLAEDPLFEIGDHTYDHAAFRVPCYGMPEARDRLSEITRSQAEISAVTGVTPTLLRFPGDCYGAADIAMARELGLVVVSGDVRSGDAFNSSPASIVGNVLAGMRPGSIVLMHLQGPPNAPMTAPALRSVIQVARQRGFQFVKVSELLGRRTPLLDPAVALDAFHSRPLAVPAGTVRLAGRAQAMLAGRRGRMLAIPSQPGKRLPSHLQLSPHRLAGWERTLAEWLLA